MQWNIQDIYTMMQQFSHIAIASQSTSKISIKGHSIVTEADKNIEAQAENFFDHPEKNCYLIGEETLIHHNQQYLQQALQHHTYIIDPIDGTVPYASLQPLWGISLAYAEQGEIKEGCIFLPATGEVIITNKEQVFYGYTGKKGKFLDLKDLHLISEEKTKADCQKPGRMLAFNQSIMRHYSLQNIPYAMGSYSSCVYPLVYLAMGRFIGATIRAHVWDLAAGKAILNKLNYDFRYTTGESLNMDIATHYNAPDFKEGEYWLKGTMIFSPSIETSKAIIAGLKEHS